MSNNTRNSNHQNHRPPTWSIENHNSFASIHVILPPQTQIHCETDAVITFSGQNVEVQGILSDGIITSLFRTFFGGESFFTTLITNNSLEQSGTVMMAPSDPGGIELYTLNGRDNDNDLLLISGAYVASDINVKITTELQSKFQNSLLSGTGFFLLRATGYGTLALGAYGAIHKFTLAANEYRSVDNGHLIAWTASMQYHVGLANPHRGILASVNSGEGLMCHFIGPGTIYLQSHKNGDPETILKKTKSGTKTITTGGLGAAAIGIFFFIFMFIILFIIGKFLTTFGDEEGGSTMHFSFNSDNTNNGYNSNYDDYDNSYDYSSNHRQQRRRRQPYRTVGEF